MKIYFLIIIYLFIFSLQAFADTIKKDTLLCVNKNSIIEANFLPIININFINRFLNRPALSGCYRISGNINVKILQKNKDEGWIKISYKPKTSNPVIGYIPYIIQSP